LDEAAARGYGDSMTGFPAERTADRSRAPRRAPHPMAMFFKGFLKHPVMVGSIIPSSRQLIQRMLAPVDWTRTRVFVEYGPGVGTFTRPLLERLAPEATLVAIDTNADFCDYLRRSIHDPRLRVVNGSAADVNETLERLGLGQADHVISGLPFSTLPPGVGPAIAEATAKAIRPGGSFLVYQFRPSVRDIIEPWFDRVDHAFELVNVPPAQLWWFHKD
jgi:phospholipid N-methyltransferase